MDFWGFIILDGRRIGYDLKLYKEIGSSKIPYDRREMKTELGDDNFLRRARVNIKKRSISTFLDSGKRSSMSSLLNCL